MSYQYNPNNYSERSFDLIPVGTHRIRIKDAEETESKKGYAMVKFTFEVSGYNSSIFYYLVFNGDTPEAAKVTDNKVYSLLDSFGQDVKQLPSWATLIGKVGAAKIKHETYEGEQKAVISYFLPRHKQQSLPSWQEPKKTPQLIPVTDDGLPF